MFHSDPKDLYSLILEDYFFSQVDRGITPEKTALFTGNLEGEDLPSAVVRRFGLSEHEAILHLIHAREEVML